MSKKSKIYRAMRSRSKKRNYSAVAGTLMQCAGPRKRSEEGKDRHCRNEEIVVGEQGGRSPRYGADGQDENYTAKEGRMCKPGAAEGGSLGFANCDYEDYMQWMRPANQYIEGTLLAIRDEVERKGNDEDHEWTQSETDKINQVTDFIVKWRKQEPGNDGSKPLGEAGFNQLIRQDMIEKTLADDDYWQFEVEKVIKCFDAAACLHDDMQNVLDGMGRETTAETFEDDEEKDQESNGQGQSSAAPAIVLLGAAALGYLFYDLSKSPSSPKI